MTANPPGATVNFRADGGDAAAAEAAAVAAGAVAVVEAVAAVVAAAAAVVVAAAQIKGIPTDVERVAAGFGVRVVHSGVWGFASSPIVTEDEIKRITRVATEVAKASAIAKKADLKLAQVPPYVAELRHADDEAAALGLADRQAGVGAVDRRQGEGRGRRDRGERHGESWLRVALLRVERRHLHRAGVVHHDAERSRSRRRSATSRARAIISASRRWAVGRSPSRPTSSKRPSVWRTEAVEMCTAKPLGSSGLRDLILSPSHAMLTIHEIVAHATEIDRIVGYEANYAGTSFVKISDIGKLKYGSKLMNITADKTDNGLGSVGYDDDGVKATKFPIIRDGILVGLQTNRETAHLIGENFSRGCTFAQFVARLSVPPDAERASGARPGQLADARRTHRRREERRDDRRPRQLLDRPAAVQRPVRRPHLLGDQERQDHAPGDGRDVQRDHDGLLGQSRRHHGAEGISEVRHGRRREGPADADELDLARVAVVLIRKMMVGAAFD